MERNITNALQDIFLETLRKDRISVSVFLVNGIRLVGRIEAFDAYVILMKNDGIIQMIYKHSVSTILPAQSASLNRNDAKEAEHYADVEIEDKRPEVIERRPPQVTVKKRVSLNARRILVLEPEPEPADKP